MAPRKRAPVEKVPQTHGGALNRGGVPGNRGGSGPMPSQLRERLRGSFADRVPVIEAIADGKPVQKVKLALAHILPHVKCPACGAKGLQAATRGKNVLQIEVTMSATPGDRLRALDLAGKYGVGTVHEVSIENVRERMRSTLAAITRHVTTEQLEKILTDIKPLWA